MKSASELQRIFQDELKWEPGLNAAEIGVSITDGVATLTGHVDSYAEKRAAEKATKRVAGVRRVANDLVVKLPSAAARDDTDLARDVLLPAPQARLPLARAGDPAVRGRDRGRHRGCPGGDVGRPAEVNLEDPA